MCIDSSCVVLWRRRSWGQSFLPCSHFSLLLFVSPDPLLRSITSLQRFKLNIASSVVTQQNSDLSSLGTDQILDLFSISSSGPIAPAVASKDGPTSQSAMLAGLGDLQPEDEYQDLDLNAFLAV